MVVTLSKSINIGVYVFFFFFISSDSVRTECNSYAFMPMHISYWLHSSHILWLCNVYMCGAHSSQITI